MLFSFQKVVYYKILWNIKLWLIFNFKKSNDKRKKDLKESNQASSIEKELRSDDGKSNNCHNSTKILDYKESTKLKNIWYAHKTRNVTDNKNYNK